MNTEISEEKSVSRRHFMKSLTSATTGLALMPSLAQAKVSNRATTQISSASYSWLTFYRREGKEWMADPDASIRDFASSGLKALEPGVTSIEQIEVLGPVLKKYGIEMKSVYIGTTLHDPATAEQSIAETVKIAIAAKKWGTTMIVSNPSPISWANPQDKDDAALTVQAASLEKLGSILASDKMTLAYHNHDVELRQGAREFSHMLSSTNPRFVSFCLDVHWIYRGTGNSQVALFDVVRMYGKRISALHIRQSKDHIWSEAFGPGDIDYPRLVTELVRLNAHPNLVLEQCLEENSPHTITASNAHSQGLKYAREVFAPLLD